MTDLPHHKTPLFKRLTTCSGLLVAVILSGCASFHANPLPHSNDLTQTPAITVPKHQLDIPAYQTQVFKAGHGMDMNQAVTVAVLNNPKLKTKRKQAGVAMAQLLQAGLIPNPQLSANLTHATSGPPPIFPLAYNTGLSESIRGLILHSSKKSAAQARVRKVNLNILWQEWQVAEKTRKLFIKLHADKRLSKLLKKRVSIYQKQYTSDQQALQAGNLTRSRVSADLVGLVHAKTALRKLERNHNKTWHAFDSLLGVKPGVHFKLSSSLSIKPLDSHQFHKAVSHLPHRRPDMLALRAGYQSQNAAVRQAILGQFPNLSVGVNKASDTSHVHSVGLSVSLALPLFNHNQGQIAIARATRARLKQAYQARLDQAVGKAHELRHAIKIMQRQLTGLKKRLPELEQTTDAAQKSFKHGNMTAGTYINLRSSDLSTRLQTIHLRAKLLQTRVALETVLGMTLGPSVQQGRGAKQ